MDGWEEDWIRLYYSEEDLNKFEEAERETQERLHVAFLGEKEIDQLKKDREICLLENTKTTQLIDSVRKWKSKDASTCGRRMEGMQEKRNEETIRELRRSASEETRSYVCDG